MSIGPIVLGDLKESCCRELTRTEVKALYKRCLPKDPLCPTVDEVEDILKYRLEHTCWRIRQVPSESRPGTYPGLQYSGREAVTSRQHNNNIGVRVTASGTCERGGSVSRFVEDLPRILSVIIDFARRDLHETTVGSKEDLNGEEDFYFDEEHSLARARAEPPNEAHMKCGYRKSQIERLGIEYCTI